MSVNCILTGQQQTGTSTKKVNPNLLLNWDFRNPVNRQGQTNYSNSSSFTVDLWKNYSASSDVTVQNGSILCSGTSYARLNQHIDRYSELQEQKLTLSIFVKGNYRFYIHNQENQTGILAYKTGMANDWECVSVTGEFTVGSEVLRVEIGNYIEGSCELKACKLEIGEMQTLAEQDDNGVWQIIDFADYTEQYTLCSQYRVGTNELCDAWRVKNDSTLLQHGSSDGQNVHQFLIKQDGTLTSNYTTDKWATNTESTIITSNNIDSYKAGSANTLANARTIQTNLGSTSAASFNGTANVTPGVTGTLPISNGGTGGTSRSSALSNLTVLNSDSYWKNAPIGVSYYSYEGSDVNTYSLPTSPCIVMTCVKFVGRRGVALAFRWSKGVGNRMWISYLHDDAGSNSWSDWMAPSGLVNLASTTAANLWHDAPRLGVTGVLPIANGGTGATSVAGILSNLGIGDLSSKPSIVFGKYAGTGNNVSQTITLGINPQAVLVMNARGARYSTNYISAYSGMAFLGYDSEGGALTVHEGGFTVDEGGGTYLNESNNNYFYLVWY